jgi:hypothetical protein
LAAKKRFSTSKGKPTTGDVSDIRSLRAMIGAVPARTIVPGTQPVTHETEKQSKVAATRGKMLPRALLRDNNQKEQTPPKMAGFVSSLKVQLELGPSIIFKVSLFQIESGWCGRILSSVFAV